jgi:hypothetical protein
MRARTRSAPARLYSPKCSEGAFCELRVDGVLGSRSSRGPAVVASETFRAGDQCLVPDVCFVYFFWSCCSWASTLLSSSSTFFSRSLTSLCTSSTFFFRSSWPASTFFFTSCLTC